MLQKYSFKLSLHQPLHKHFEMFSENRKHYPLYADKIPKHFMKYHKRKILGLDYPEYVMENDEDNLENDDDDDDDDDSGPEDDNTSTDSERPADETESQSPAGETIS